jgi:hypothetical protein
MASMLSGLGTGVGVSAGAGVAEGSGVSEGAIVVVGSSVGEATNVTFAGAAVVRGVGCGVRISTMMVVVGCGLLLQATSREKANITIPYRLALVTFFISHNNKRQTGILNREAAKTAKKT